MLSIQRLRYPVLAGLLIVVLSQVSHAQQATPSQQADQIQQRQQQEFQQDRLEIFKPIKPSGETLESPAVATTKEGNDASCYPIATINIKGGSHLTDDFRNSINEKYAGRCLGVEEISQILGVITKYYVEHGYITSRAYLPAQDLKLGILHIEILEGMIQGFEENPRGENSIAFSTAFPFLQGKILNLRDLEQGVEQINRLQSNNAKLEIKPGTQAGESVVVVHNKAAQRWRANISMDNHGASSTGKNQTALQFTFDNVLGVGDLIGYTHRESVPDSPEHTAMSDGLNLSIPFGYNAFSLDANSSSYSNYISLPSGAKQAAKGYTESFRIGWDRALFRDQVSKTNFGLGLGTMTPKNYFADQFLQVSSIPLTVIDTKLGYSRAVQDGTLSLSVGYSRGLNELGAFEDSKVLPYYQPHAQFEKYTVNLRLNVPFMVGRTSLIYDTEMSLQSAGHGLYGSQKILIGSNYTVRGFVNNSVSGDSGYFWRNEVSLPTQFGTDPVKGKVYGALDTGAVVNQNSSLSGGNLVGATLGVQMRWGVISVDAYATTPIGGNANVNFEPTWFWLSVSAKI
jgi:hemolysin activation/secretion protein